MSELPARGLRRRLAAGALLLGAALSSSCTGDTCGRPICGCWEDVSVTLEITVVDQLGDPIPGIDALCVNEDTPVATSGDDGVISTRFETRVSEACGTERCNSVTLSDPTGACSGTESSLLALNRSTVALTCGSPGDDDDSAR
jgi:hypothetical protein